MWISTSEISVLTREFLASECLHAGAAARVLYESQRVDISSWARAEACDKDTPTFTFKKGPLWEIRRDNNQPSEEFQGVYMITGVKGGKSGAVARAPTYTIVARWSKEQT
eukprot:SAG25_NODE_6271_length_573_cov_0.867089_1_plen_109_part_10